MIEVKNISKSIGKEKVLDHVSVSMENGNIYSFEGRNGSGKTMLFRAICGLITIDSGEILIDGNKVGPNGAKANIGLLLENPSFLNGLTGYQNLEMIASIRKVVGPDRILEVLQRVGLQEARNKKYETYSLGMKQRLGIANVILEMPDILIFDEPTNAIDEEGVKVLITILKEEKDRQKIILISSHEKTFISSIADVHYWMKKGSILTKDAREQEREAQDV